VAEGLLELLSSALLGSLLRRLPQGEPVAENVPGSLLAPQWVERPGAEGFSGYALLRFGDGLGWLAFRQGKLLEAWRERGDGYLAGLEAYRAIREGLEWGRLSLYRLPPETVLPLLTLTRGSLRAAAIPAASVIAADLFASLGQEGFSGALVLEDPSTSAEAPPLAGGLFKDLPPAARAEGAPGQAWYFLGGQVLFGAEVPQGLGQGRLHLVQMPLKDFPDLLELFAQEEQLGRAQQLEALWNAVGAVLREYMGRGAVPALDRLRRSHPGEDPVVLRPALRRWLETRLEPNAAQMFDRLAKG
jgi:hypothetical protein